MPKRHAGALAFAGNTRGRSVQHIASRIGYTGASFSKHPEAHADKEGFLSVA